MFGDTPLTIVEDNATLLEAVQALSAAPVLGVDTEADSFHRYQEKVCLIQVSDNHQDFIIDPLKLDDLSPLGPLFSDPTKVKVLHGADYDIVSLQRDFGFRFSNIFDTMLAAQFIGLPRIGLADLIHHYFGHKVDKKYQRHDWSRRPLMHEHLEYARGDTHFLAALHEILTRRLRQGRRMRALEEECELLELREWTGRKADPAAFLRVKGSKELNVQEKRVLWALWDFRDGMARDRDRPAFKVMSDHILRDLAKAQPEDLDQLAENFKKGSSLVRRYGDGLVEAVMKGKADEREIPKPTSKQRRKRPKGNGGGASIDRLLGPLKEWRNQVVQQEQLNPVVVANNTLLKEIARAAPEDLEALTAVPGIRKWQVREYGEALVGVVKNQDAPPKSRKRRRRRRNNRGGAAQGGSATQGE